jgi:hypothetical protein
MNRVRHLGIIVAVVISLFLIFSQAVYASIDAGAPVQTARAYYLGVGTFNLIIQVLIGSFVAVLAVVGLYWARVRNFLGNLFKKGKADVEGEKIGDSEKIEDVEKNE